MNVIGKYSKQSGDKVVGDSLQNDTSNSVKSVNEGLRISTLRQGAMNISEPSPTYSKGKEVYNILALHLSNAKNFINSIKQSLETPPSNSGATENGNATPSTTLHLVEQLESCLLNIENSNIYLRDMLFDEANKSSSLENTVAILSRENENLKDDVGSNGRVSIDRCNSRPMSVASSAATGEDEFFDATEIIISEGISGDDDQDGMLCTEDSSQIDDDDDDDDSLMEACEPSKPQDSTITHLHSGKDSLQLIHRRRALPSPVSGPDVSIMSILRKNVGKDLSSVAMPVALNEPLNLLQRLCEELEYSELLDKASEASDSIDRLAYVTAFALSAYGSSQSRTGRKPFNPLLGETYECDRPDKGFKFIAEKVLHHPPIMACYAESPHYKFWQESSIKSKFWGKSIEMIPSGTVHVELPKHNELYTYSKPSTWVRNMLAGTRYLEHSGDVRITNHTTNEYSILTFKEGTFFKSSNNEVQASLYNAQGEVVRTLSGKWNHAFWTEYGEDKYEVIWHVHPPLSNASDYYGFTQFSMELNEITADIKDKLPHTDTRYRPDQRLFELGEVDKADEEKLRLEQLQRERRKQMEAAGETWTPQWFEKRADPHSPEHESWQYTGGYWEARAQGTPPSKVELW
ncbi:Oxysterol-binding protein 3, variant 2 [Basidiobolus ranarum]